MMPPVRVVAKRYRCATVRQVVSARVCCVIHCVAIEEFVHLGGQLIASA